ncbi:hypothetical protein DdX_04797 [Ditylenchus destructor]|uniref:Uncharacterized protein n=1 Tax=Ditylenchus destructor TaxID=166010 RepID=A0AAD4ND66_9BILA|nr:hypothetical protein DdX_04797 [Ditylenchus destructor]
MLTHPHNTLQLQPQLYQGLADFGETSFDTDPSILPMRKRNVLMFSKLYRSAWPYVGRNAKERKRFAPELNSRPLVFEYMGN